MFQSIFHNHEIWSYFVRFGIYFDKNLSQIFFTKILIFLENNDIGHLLKIWHGYFCPHAQYFQKRNRQSRYYIFMYIFKKNVLVCGVRRTFN